MLLIKAERIGSPYRNRRRIKVYIRDSITWPNWLNEAPPPPPSDNFVHLAEPAVKLLYAAVASVVTTTRQFEVVISGDKVAVITSKYILEVIDNKKVVAVNRETLRNYISDDIEDVEVAKAAIAVVAWRLRLQELLKMLDKMLKRYGSLVPKQFVLLASEHNIKVMFI